MFFGSIGTSIHHLPLHQAVKLYAFLVGRGEKVGKTVREGVMYVLRGVPPARSVTKQTLSSRCSFRYPFEILLDWTAFPVG